MFSAWYREYQLDTLIFDEHSVPVRTHSMFEQTLTNPVLDFRDRVVKLLGDSLTLECVNGVRVGGSGHNDERDNGHFGPRLLQSEV